MLAAKGGKGNRDSKAQKDASVSPVLVEVRHLVELTGGWSIEGEWQG